MMQEFRISGNNRGFSMIEIILVLVVAAIMFAMMFAYFNRSLMDSALPVVRLNQSMSLTSVAERITGHYIEGDPSLSIEGRSQDVLDKISDNLKNLSNNLYGDNFTVDTNEFITFTNNNDEPDTTDPTEANKTLKITIRHKVTNETLTLLLTDWSRTSQ